MKRNKVQANHRVRCHANHPGKQSKTDVSGINVLLELEQEEDKSFKTQNKMCHHD